MQDHAIQTCSLRRNSISMKCIKITISQEYVNVMKIYAEITVTDVDDS